MILSDLLTTLNSQGIRLWADGDKLRMSAPKGALTAQLKADITAYKEDILKSLSRGSPQLATVSTECGLSLGTIGQLIGGDRTALPVTDPGIMAKQLQVTFRPLPKGTDVDKQVLALRDTLEETLKQQGVRVVMWDQATRKIQSPLPVIGGFIQRLRPACKQLTLTAVRSEINAVIDVERPVSVWKSWIAERFYQLSTGQVGSRSHSPATVADITRRIGWAEDHAIQRLEDPTATQVILLTPLDQRFTNAEIPYTEKIGLGVDTLISQFSEIVIGVSEKEISILNMNLSDSLFPKAQLEKFVQRSLIPKIYVPISPLPLSRFEIGRYCPVRSPYAQKLVQMSQVLANTGLFPSGFQLSEVVHRQSHRDIVAAIINGRTGVSYGFVAYAEPPQYVGPVEISEARWQVLSAIDGLSSREIRQTDEGRRYIKTLIGEQIFYKQIPDIWLVCSRSGANKTNLSLTEDILRLGVNGSLQLQLPENVDLATSKVDIKPSYDTYVMVAIALSAALYIPELVQNGAPIIHFHGYPEKDWFGDSEDVAGSCNPAVPCGTYESGVFNFLSLHQLAGSEQRLLKLAGLIEPDHGINLLAQDTEYLLERVQSGVARSQIELGGRYLPTFNSAAPAHTFSEQTPNGSDTDLVTSHTPVSSGGRS